jgi:hypothetical protein
MQQKASKLHRLNIDFFFALPVSSLTLAKALMEKSFVSNNRLTPFSIPSLAAFLIHEGVFSVC